MTAYQVLNVDMILLVRSFVGEQNYLEFNSLGNWKPVQVELNRGDAVKFARASNKSSRGILH